MKMSNNPKYEALIKQYLRSILDISAWDVVASNEDKIYELCRQAPLAITFRAGQFALYPWFVLFLIGP